MTLRVKLIPPLQGKEVGRFLDKFCVKCDLRGTNVPERSHFVAESEVMSLRVKLIPFLQGEEAMRFLDKLFILNVTGWSQL